MVKNDEIWHGELINLLLFIWLSYVRCLEDCLFGSSLRTLAVILVFRFLYQVLERIRALRFTHLAPWGRTCRAPDHQRWCSSLSHSTGWRRRARNVRNPGNEDNRRSNYHCFYAASESAPRSTVAHRVAWFHFGARHFNSASSTF